MSGKGYDSIPDEIKNPPMFYDWDGNPIGLRTWCELFEADRQVALSEVELPGGQKAMVSTVYMGISRAFMDGAINIFETGLFWEAGDSKTFDDDIMRWSTREAALAGHDQMVAFARNLGQIPIETREGFGDE